MLIQAVPVIGMNTVSFCELYTTGVSTTLKVSVSGPSVQSYSNILSPGAMYLSLDFSWEGPPPYTVMVAPQGGAWASATVLESSAIVTYVPISGVAPVPPFLVVRTPGAK
ncbi:MAG TPA: hypothetical protein VHG08_25280 [Longimicrobium sp.]|nr:hypothetical protein [Longimicrobium sp.]